MPLHSQKFLQGEMVMSRLYLISNWDQSGSLQRLQVKREYDVWYIYLHELVIICFHFSVPQYIYFYDYEMTWKSAHKITMQIFNFVSSISMCWSKWKNHDGRGLIIDHIKWFSFKKNFNAIRKSIIKYIDTNLPHSLYEKCPRPWNSLYPIKINNEMNSFQP